ncbi:MAG: rhodanese-like domain-containing protein [Thermoleophilia bacterium]
MGYGTSLLENSSQPAGCMQIDSAQAQTLIDERNALVVDVREPHEYAAGRIPNAMLIPLRQIGAQVESLRQHTDRPIILSCRTGSRSQMACRFLSENGLENVYNLASGLIGWQRANYSVAR